jgi:hypothetical protein
MLLQLRDISTCNKLIVKKATRKDAILDFVLTNMNKYYKEPRIFPPFGLSDHCGRTDKEWRLFYESLT